LWRFTRGIRHLATTIPALRAIAPASRRGASGIPLAALNTSSASHTQEEVMRAIKTSVVLAVGFIGMFAGSARAQEAVVARVPFAFVVRGQEFPAGRYNLTTEQGLLTIRGIDNNAGLFAMTTPAGGADPIGDQPALVFVRYEKTYRLSQIWDSSSEGLVLQGPSGEVPRTSAASEAPIVVAANVK
jgi:hypothetical protein